MKIKVSDYIVNFFNKNGITTVFTITGGFAMHLNDSFGNHSKYKSYYQHHEQACGYSAVGFSKTKNQPTIVCTTAGCAAANAITPCLVCYQDSVPVLFISGQVKSTECISKINTENINLRHYAGADCDIVSMVKTITKYSKEILNIFEIPSILKEAHYNLTNGRLGPVWLSVPIDIQASFIEINELSDYNALTMPKLSAVVHTEEIFTIYKNIDKINTLLQNSKRPLIIAGNGIKLGNCIEKFRQFIDLYKIPFVVSILSTDIIETEHPFYSGKIGLIGDRHGNFSLQNCDLLISFGCRMAQGIIGYCPEWFARESKIIYIDNDKNELQKDNLTYEMKINMDLNIFFDNTNKIQINNYDEWIKKCQYWKNKWIFELPPYDDNVVNPYYVLKSFYEDAPNNKISISSAGSIVTNVWHMINIKSGDKFIHSSQGDMGFELPAAIGSQIAEPCNTVISIIGDGSFQFNIQELQTISHYNLPVKILLFNNGGYGANIITQNNFFKKKFGVDSETGISFPCSEKISNAYDIKYINIKNNYEIKKKIHEFLEYKGPIILEVFCCIQIRHPKLHAIKNEDGTFSNRPFEDMSPFLRRDDFEKEMIVKII
jgi:acetolactate synthase-1/2/3 large subunit